MRSPINQSADCIDTKFYSDNKNWILQEVDKFLEENQEKENPIVQVDEWLFC